MGGLECVITGLMDEYTAFFKSWKHSREIFTLGVIIVSFSVALINVTPGGIYTFNLFDTYSAGISLLCSALFEAIAVSWFYGLDRFTQDVEAMIGSKPGLYWRICWKFISPTFIIVGPTPFSSTAHLKLSDFRWWCCLDCSTLNLLNTTTTSTRSGQSGSAGRWLFRQS
jgi:SNF family Na+-dependent transporter